MKGGCGLPRLSRPSVWRVAQPRPSSTRRLATSSDRGSSSNSSRSPLKARGRGFGWGFWCHIFTPRGGWRPSGQEPSPKSVTSEYPHPAPGKRKTKEEDRGAQGARTVRRRRLGPQVEVGGVALEGREKDTRAPPHHPLDCLLERKSDMGLGDDGALRGLEVSPCFCSGAQGNVRTYAKYEVWEFHRAFVPEPRGMYAQNMFVTFHAPFGIWQIR